MGTPVLPAGRAASQLPARRAVLLVARREFRAQVVKRSFVVSNLIVLLVIAGGIIGFSIFSGSGEPDRSTVGVVGAAPLGASVADAAERAGMPVEIRPLASAEQGRAAVEAGDLDVALVPGDGGAVAVVDSELPSGLGGVLDAVLAGQARDAALSGLGVTPETLAQRTAPAVLTVDALDPPDPEAGQRTALSVAALFLLFGQILGFGTYVAMGVVEEKSSRVVELLLSTIRPLHLLWGKIVGIGTVGLLQLAAYGVVGLAAGLGTGMLTLTGTAVGVFASVLGWFVLGFAFYAVLYAAAGSMVSRQEDVNSTTTPLMLSLFLMYGAAFYYLGSPDSPLMTVLPWLPPFSAILMPLRIADGSASTVQIVVTVLLMLASTAVLAWIAARVFHRSVLRTGSRVPWREALGRAGS
ncbi:MULTISPECIES: ABC transporter permease [Pseudonocardia]|uniref:ABC-2 family transporter protein n=2 Tax=Pseudonocardia TaxID=1847 RepID=A0A1Y2MVD5_PSEAH|nr:MULTISPECIES: ABC transporter permease [Pseudonocardia]OSY39150.1 ABC-2 family transporter protein [Pseudonocardia autotrophica]TDN71255.1 ABC-2 type transport system permease protein [Pseudonocardia autotrophica]BBG01927.1 ABC transporter permease [Pseudonocardia autotrophica]GEC23091.1 ABC transporter permease [Pseudonocardia saturnea]